MRLEDPSLLHLNQFPTHCEQACDNSTFRKLFKW